MTQTVMPPDGDLPWFRTQAAARMGVPTGNIGILPDAEHKEGGGYHCGPQDIKDIGKWGSAGSSTADYSVRQPRDRIGGNVASAMDVDDDWPHGGRAAWIRWNNMVVYELQHHPERLGGLRAINFTPDGTVKRRYDSNNPGAGVIPSTDTVTWHTHLEWWRDMVGNRMAGFLRMLDLMDDAIANRPARSPITATGQITPPPPAPPTPEDDMLIEIPDVITFASISLPSKTGRRLNICNDMYLSPMRQYGLRIMRTNGDGSYSPMPGAGALLWFGTGQAWDIALPDETKGLTIRRWGWDGTNFIDPDVDPTKVYSGPLTVSIC